MDVPTLVSEALGDEEVAAHVPLKGDDALYVTPTRTLRYSEEGLLSDESIASFSHGAERVSVSTGRRKATITLDYGTDGTEEFSVPVGDVEAALHPVLAGVLNANGVTGPGETVTRTFRFSELTVVVTSDRLVKHIGSAVWDREFEEIPYEQVTGLAVEEGNVSSQFVLSTPERTQRIKAPNESFREVQETIEEAILSYHDVDSVAAFEALVEDDQDGADGGETPQGTTGDVSFDSGIDPLGSGSSVDDTGADRETDAQSESDSPTATEPDAEGPAKTNAGTGAEPRAEKRGGANAEASAGPREPGTARTSGEASAESREERGPEASAESREERGPEASAGTSSGTGEDSREASSESLEEQGFMVATETVEPAIDPAELRDELDDLEAAIERQQKLLEEQRDWIENLRSVIPDR